MPFDYHKQVSITEAMLAQIEKVTGAAVLPDDVVVFEATAANTRPVSQRGSLHNGAVITKATLDEMAQRLNSATEAVPLHTLHNQGWELPVGKVFQASVVSAADGNYELRAFFFLAKTETALIERINLGIIDEVSIGLMAKQLMCSECGYDYVGEGADMEAIFSQTCANGHTIGVDGVHLILSGVDSWSELSLVSRGATRNAKIHGRARQSSPVQERLAASGFTPAAILLSSVPTPEKEAIVPDPNPDVVALTANLAALTAIVTELTELAKPPVVVVPPVIVADPALLAAQAELELVKAELAEAKKVKPATLTADLPAGGLAAAAIADATKTVAVLTGVFKSPRKA